MLTTSRTRDSSSDENPEDILQEISDLLMQPRHNETKWRHRNEMLEKEGYVLRPRLQPDWSPSWLKSGESPLSCEDGEPLPARSKLVDATHKETGRMVYIKEIETDSMEHRIAKLLMQEDWVNDPRSHCVPIMKIFQDHTNPTISYLVMPFLRPVDSPPFETVKEIIEFVDQILEGLVFLHEKGVAHRDCVLANILMDGDAMYPEGFHPIALNQKRDYSGVAPYRSRSDAGVKYYYVDFGISVYLPEDVEMRFVTGIFGRDRDPPELSWSPPRPYDPFKLDIFIIGNMLRREFLEPFCNVDFLEEIIAPMRSPIPDRRPDAATVLAEWKKVRETVGIINREWRPRPRREHPIGSVIFDAISMHRAFMFFAKSFVRSMPM